MKKFLILLGFVMTICLTTGVVYASSNNDESSSEASRVCMMCHGKACPQNNSGTVCNCGSFYQCNNCSFTVCYGCYYKYVNPNLNKGCPHCKSSKGFEQVSSRY